MKPQKGSAFFIRDAFCRVYGEMRFFLGISSLFLVVSACECGGETGALPDAQFPDSGLTDSTLGNRDVDNGCDPVTGQGCPCPGEGDERSCSTGGVGACGMGTQVCEVTFEFPAWGPCGGEPDATDETCNGIDDNCDGTVDEGFGDVSCGSGACTATTTQCVSGVEQNCVPGTADDEVCDGIDNDCDDTVDEEQGDLTCGTGACERTVAACVGGAIQVCAPGAPVDEACNGDDDDCDSAVDEGLGRVSCGVGECAASRPACAGGVLQVCNPGTPTTEICDGLDNDCNGTVDDGFGTVVCGVGECRRVAMDCSGGMGTTCTPGAPAAEVCDGLDNDCDGVNDNGLGNLACGVGECRRVVAACTGGTPNICTPGTSSPEICNGDDDDCDSRTDEGLGDITCGVGACERTVASCVGGSPRTCTPGSPGAEVCGDMIDNDCDGMVDEMCGCMTTIDADFDGFNECVDCDDANGGVFPGRTEICNGIDEDCDTLIDEDFDGDGDGFSTCSSDPLLRDCNDMSPTVYPGAPELCGATGMGNGIDENCNGFIDETCAPCSTTDADGDGVTECAGDCDDGNPNISPMQPEICDGIDNDCNVFTVKNCDVSNPCNFASGADVCEDDLLCGCVVSGGGVCTGNYICTSFCEGSFTGPLGSGCTATQTCGFRVTITDNLHGCGETTDTLGTGAAGSTCSGDTDCRSGSCDRLCVGMGCSQRYCLDYCSHHDPGADGSCAPGTICELVQIGGASPAMYARCRLDNNGTGATGDSCSGGTTCQWGPASCVSGICAEPCGLDAHCPMGTHCSFEGTSLSLGTWGAGAPSYVVGQTAVETVPVCLTDTGAGLHDRPAGAACSRNGDCSSQFCERTLNVCIATCTSDGSCPTGLGCEPQHVRNGTGVTLARVCMSTPVSALLEPM